MNRRTSLLIFFLGIIVFPISGCLPGAYDTSTLCENRKVVYCEDFETISPSVYTFNPGGSGWAISEDEVLSQTLIDLPVEGRTPDYLAAIGYLNNNYEDNTQALLYTESINLTNATRATLYFNLLYLTEPHWDGLILIATRDQGDTWNVLEPIGGYPDALMYEGTTTPGYSGNKPYWIHEEVDLDSLVGSEVILGFYFLSDAFNVNYGVALDDIVVDADINIGPGGETQIQDISEVVLFLPKDPLLTVEIPRLTSLIDTPCENEEISILKEGQRAYAKAINQNGDRFFVLHPDTSNFCWVGQEDVWVNDQDFSLPQLSDLKPEDLFQPICVLSKAPILTNATCDTGAGSGEDNPSLLPYQIQSALVEGGKIITVAVDIGNGPAGDNYQENPEYRISSVDGIPGVNINPGIGPGGTIAATLNGVKQTCSLDRGQPGRVICENLSLDAAGPLNIEICWQGWDENSFCPPGLSANPAGEGCILLPNSGSCTPGCPDGYQYSERDARCLPKRDLAVDDQYADSCPAGFMINSEAGCCVSIEPTDRLDCPTGYYYSPEESSCLRVPDEGNCPEGTLSQGDPITCVPEINTISSLCATFDVSFPVPEVTLKETTRCLRGPGNSYEIVSSLKPFNVVDVLGIGEGGEYLVINNPKFQIPCWANMDDFYLEKLDQTILPIIPELSSDEQSSGESNQQQP